MRDSASPERVAGIGCAAAQTEEAEDRLTRTADFEVIPRRSFENLLRRSLAARDRWTEASLKRIHGLDVAIDLTICEVFRQDFVAAIFRSCYQKQ